MAGHCDEFIAFITNDIIEEYTEWLYKNVILDKRHFEGRQDMIAHFFEERKQNRVTKEVPL